MSEFTPECYFCDDPVENLTEPGTYNGAHVTFKSGHEAFVCEPHFQRAQALDQCTEARLVQTGIDRVLKARGEQ